ncbi:unnamed protein product [Anisakis simplex]|uniref:ANAPC4_WD40 domain-containing protein n=1 Tax=Anisakis simplex TaxID=6269 RepID=A0A0M3JXL0_ANISI|nr:unnamed protein product [Anisakis simplex]
MAVLIEERVEQNITDTIHELLEWHQKSGRFAVSSFNPNIGAEVNFFTEHGGRSEHEPIRRAGVRFTQLKWHPNEDLVVVASNDGDLLLRYADDTSGTHY